MTPASVRSYLWPPPHHPLGKGASLMTPKPLVQLTLALVSPAYHSRGWHSRQGTSTLARRDSKCCFSFISATSFLLGLSSSSAKRGCCCPALLPPRKCDRGCHGCTLGAENTLWTSGMGLARFRRWTKLRESGGHGDSDHRLRSLHSGFIQRGLWGSLRDRSTAMGGLSTVCSHHSGDYHGETRRQKLPTL